MFLQSHLRAAALSAAILIVSGCAGIPQDRGLADSQALLTARGGPAVSALRAEADPEPQSAAWLAAPLSIESAQRIALTRNPLLVRQYARLGIAQADVYEAARVSNPMFSLSWLDASTGGAQIGLGLAQNFADLLYLSPRKRRASGELLRTQQQVADELLKLASAVEAAYYGVVGAMAVADLREAIAFAGAASATLAQRFFEAGNISRLDLSREQAAATTVRIEAERAAATVLSKRADLNTLMGLPAEEDHWVIATHLALPVGAEDNVASLQTLAQSSRLDLLAARQAVVVEEDVLGMTRSYRFLGDTEVGVDYERETDDSRLLGPALRLALPIFNWGSGRIERAKANLEQSQAAVRQMEIEISNDVQRTYAQVSSTRERVERYRAQLIPQREEVVRRATESQNYMLIGQFELLQVKQQAYDAYQGYLETLADYWIARAALTKAVGARLPSSSHIDAAGVEPERLISPQKNDDGHVAHGAHSDAADMPGMDMKGGMDMKDMPGMETSGHDMRATPSQIVNPASPPETRHTDRPSTDGARHAHH